MSASPAPLTAKSMGITQKLLERESLRRAGRMTTAGMPSAVPWWWASWANPNRSTRALSPLLLRGDTPALDEERGLRQRRVDGVAKFNHLGQQRLGYRCRDQLVELVAEASIQEPGGAQASRAAASRAKRHPPPGPD